MKKIREDRQMTDRSFSQSGLAAKIKLGDPGTLARWERGVTKPSEVHMMAWANAVGVDPAEAVARLNGTFRETDRSAKMNGAAGPGHGIPIIGSLNAGGLVQRWESRHLGSDDELPFILVGIPDAFALRVDGDSMRPAYEDGDILVLQYIECEELRPGEPAYVQLDGSGDSECTLKRCLPEGHDVWLVPINGDFAPMKVACEKINKVGRILWRCVPVSAGRRTEMAQ